MKSNEPFGTSLDSDFSDLVHILVLCFDGRKARLVLDAYDTVAGLERAVEAEKAIGVPVGRQHLWLNGRPLADKTQRLKDVPGMKKKRRKKAAAGAAPATTNIRLKVAMLFDTNELIRRVGSGGSGSCSGSSNRDLPSKVRTPEHGSTVKAQRCAEAETGKHYAQLKLSSALVAFAEAKQANAAAVKELKKKRLEEEVKGHELEAVVEEAANAARREKKKVAEAKRQREQGERICSACASGKSGAKKAAAALALEATRSRAAAQEAMSVLGSLKVEAAAAVKAAEVKVELAEAQVGKVDRGQKKLQRTVIALHQAQTEREMTLEKWREQRYALEAARSEGLKAQLAERASCASQLAEIGDGSSSAAPSSTRQRIQARLSLLEQQEVKAQAWLEQERGWQDKVDKLNAKLLASSSQDAATATAAAAAKHPKKKETLAELMSASLAARRASDLEFERATEELLLATAPANSSSSNSAKAGVGGDLKKIDTPVNSAESDHRGESIVDNSKRRWDMRHTLLCQNRMSALEVRDAEDARARVAREDQARDEIVQLWEVEYEKVKAGGKTFFEAKKRLVGLELSRVTETQVKPKKAQREAVLGEAREVVSGEDAHLAAISEKLEEAEELARDTASALKLLGMTNTKQRKQEVEKLLEDETRFTESLRGKKAAFEAFFEAFEQFKASAEERAEGNSEVLLNALKKAQDRVESASKGVAASVFEFEEVAALAEQEAAAKKAAAAVVLRFDLHWGVPFGGSQESVLDGACLLYKGTTLLHKVCCDSPSAPGVTHRGGVSGGVSDHTERSHQYLDVDFGKLGEADRAFFTLSSCSALPLSSYKRPSVSIEQLRAGQAGNTEKAGAGQSCLASYSIKEGGQSAAVVMCEALKNADDGSWAIYEIGKPSEGRADRKGFLQLDSTCVFGIIIDNCENHPGEISKAMSL